MQYWTVSTVRFREAEEALPGEFLGAYSCLYLGEKVADRKVAVLGNRESFLLLLDELNTRGGGTWTHVAVW